MQSNTQSIAFLERKVINIENLFDKAFYSLSNELDEYIEQVKKLPTDSMVRDIFEITIKDEIVESFRSSWAHTDEEYASILLLDKPLKYLYEKVLDREISNIVILVEDSVNKILNDLVFKIEKIKESEDYNLIKNINELIDKIKVDDITNKFSELFNIQKINILSINDILKTKSDTKKLYHFLTSTEFKKNIVNDIELSKKNDENIIPNLQQLIKKNKEIER